MDIERNRCCCFAGHSKLYDSAIIDRVVTVARTLITEHSVTEFLVGNYGSFDAYAAAAVRRLKKEYPQITLSLVIPYLTQEINEYRDDYYKKYDSIIVATIPESTPRNLKIIKTNEYMVNESDYIICYVNTSWGGAAKTMEYAQHKNIEVINLGSLTL